MQKFEYEIVKNTEIFQQNRLNAHSDHVAHESVEAMEEKNTAYRKCLDGIWKFSYAKNIDCVIPGFEAEDYDVEGWDDIRVPAHIQMEGYDAPQYANVQYPWDGREELVPGQIPSRFNIRIKRPVSRMYSHEKRS